MAVARAAPLIPHSASREAPQPPLPAAAFEKWEIVPAVLLVACGLLWAVPAFFNERPLDLGLAYRGGQEAWETGRPERLRTWMSTPFLGMVMALFSRLVPLPTAMRLVTALNLALAASLLAFVWRSLRGRVPRGWWWTTLALAVLYAPLISSVWFKQFNILALSLALAGFEAVRRGRAAAGGSLIALSLCLKPIVVLLPLALLARRDTRRSGLWVLGWSALLAAVAQVFLAIRAGDPAVLVPMEAVKNFADKTVPWVCHPENFAPQGLLCRLTGTEPLGFQRLFAGLALLLFVVMASDVLRDHRGGSWEVFSFVCLLSPMASPISWTHYQLFLAPMLLLLAYQFFRLRAGWSQWAGLVASFFLAELVLRPLDSVPGIIGAALAGRFETRPQALRMMAASQFAQYVLFLTAFGWFNRLRGLAAGEQAEAVAG